jgi:hypothetical protein
VWLKIVGMLTIGTEEVSTGPGGFGCKDVGVSVSVSESGCVGLCEFQCVGVGLGDDACMQ